MAKTGTKHWYRWFGSRFSQEGLEIAAGQEFEHDESRMFVETDPDKVDDVGVVELGHDQRLHEKVHFRLVGRQFRQRLHSGQHSNTLDETFKQNKKNIPDNNQALQLSSFKCQLSSSSSFHVN